MSRHRILRRVREALESRERVEHPGEFAGWRTAGGAGPEGGDAVTAFAEAFQAVGGEVLRASGPEEARERLAALAEGAAGISTGVGVPDGLLPELPRLEPRDAPLGVSMARGAAAETGSLLLDARDGRRAQLLPPVHVVLVAEEEVRATLAEALQTAAGDLPSGLGLHSGPSKSADIGQVLVQGVHGPGRLVALVVRGLAGPGDGGRSPA